MKNLESTPTLTFADNSHPHGLFKSPCLSRKKSYGFAGIKDLSSGDKKFELSQKVGLHQALDNSAQYSKFFTDQKQKPACEKLNYFTIDEECPLVGIGEDPQEEQQDSLLLRTAQQPKDEIVIEYIEEELPLYKSSSKDEEQSPSTLTQVKQISSPMVTPD